jgi:hypothetical protein
MRKTCGGMGRLLRDGDAGENNEKKRCQFHGFQLFTPKDQAQNDANDSTPQERIDQHEQDEKNAGGTDGSKREACPF